MQQERCRGDEVIEGRAVLIVAVAHAKMPGSRRRGNAGGSLRAQRFGSSSDDAVSELLDALVDAEGLIGVRFGPQRLHADQPRTLQEIDEQQRRCGKLRAAESNGMEKSAQHWRNKARPSVLPCPGR